MAEAADPIEHLIGLLSRLPGLGRRSARRAVLKMLMRPEQQMLPLAEALQKAAEAVRPCRVCGNLDARDPCGICRDPDRERELICVVEGVADLWALERAHAHRGLYHVLGGTLSPLGGLSRDYPPGLRAEIEAAMPPAAKPAVSSVVWETERPRICPP